MSLKKFLTGIWYYLTSPEYRLVKKSRLFDPEYYLKSNPDVSDSGIDPLVHYLKTGAAENRSPWPYFDHQYYLHQLPALQAGEVPLVHYLRVGKLQNLRPNPLVDPQYYTLHTPGFTASGPDPVSHFLDNCDKSCRSCALSPYFDHLFYCRKYPDVSQLANDPVAAYRHFLTVGIKEERQPSVFFDPAWYADKTPALHEHRVNAIWHYFLYGLHEKKSPSPLFDPEHYGRTCEVDGEEDLFAHYLRHEPTADTRPCGWFDPVFYRQTYLAADSGADSPLGHYLQQGLARQAYPNREVAELAVKPLVSVVVPVFNVLPAYLNSCIRSLLYQSYPHWQLCLADDCSTDDQIRPLLERWQALDSRIKVTFLPDNRGISGATNAAAALATGDYLAFLDNDDELAPEALFAFVKAMAEQGGDLIYCDEDLIGADGRRFSVFRKPAYNGELLLCHNYVTHLVVTKRALFARVGGCNSRMNGAQDHDLFLKLAEQAKKIVHLPEILYHWRASESSTSVNHSQKDYANEAGRKSVAGALVRRQIAGRAENTELKFFYRARRQVAQGLSVALLIDWRRPAEPFHPWLSQLIAGAGYAVGQVVVTVRTAEQANILALSGGEADIPVTPLIVPADSGPADAYNLAAGHVRGDFLAIVDCFLEVTSMGWLAALLEYGQQEKFGIVGGRIAYPPDQPEVTPLPDFSDGRPLSYARFLANCSVLMNGLHCPQEVRSVTGEICLLRTAKLRESGGFNAEEYPRLFFVQDLAFRLGLLGQSHVYTPYCAASFADSSGFYEPQTLAPEMTRFQHRWAELLRQGDPFYNPGLLTDRQFSLASFANWLTGSATSIDETN